MSDDRLGALAAWVTAALKDSGCSLRPASGDASFRRYFRVRASSGRTYIAMDAPPDKEDCRPYVNIARSFRAIGLNVPEIVAEDLGRGLLLITDLGDRLYLDTLSELTVGDLYRDALLALLVIQRDATGSGLPPYSDTLLHQEMELFREWYVGRHLGVALTPSQHTVLDRVFDLLATAALAQPQVVVHRDYHSRNLMVTDINNPGILDFQDAVVGPVTYDLVSLLRDCYIAWPRQRVESWAQEYFLTAGKAGIPVGCDFVEFLRWFDWMGVQRHLKAIGIFARLNHRDGKPSYLKDIPRVIDYVADVAGRYAELEALHHVVRTVAPTRSSNSVKPT